MRRLTAVLVFLCVSTGLRAQMTPEQRLFDFEVLTSLYAKRYAPYHWKREALGADLYNVGPWKERVRNAADDLGYFEIAAEYVASFEDTHSHFRVPSSFVADLGFLTDIYDGKVLIDWINRAVLPASAYPFQIGDELVSVDGLAVEEIIARIARIHRYGNPETTRRYAARYITYRQQVWLPRTAELGDSAAVVIRRENGDHETYEIPWTKTGMPLTNVGPVPSPLGYAAAAARNRSTDGAPDYLKPLRELQNWALPEDLNPYLGEFEDDKGNVAPKHLIATGTRSPIFRLPGNFIQRLGASAIDFHYSGTYESDGFRIGYIRVPSFGPPSTAIRELDAEIAHMQNNTDGLVLDVMQNPGGGCYMADLAARFMPGQFYFFGEQIRPTMDRISSMQSALEAAKRTGADQWIVDTYQFLVGMLLEAYRDNRGLTGLFPACSQSNSGRPPSIEHTPAATVYSKPLIILVDAFSISAADIFPAMMQDNGRGIVVGMRTSGGGGSVSSWPAGFYSEATSSNTNSLVVRNHHVATPEYPTAPYVENIGVRPDIQLDFMTRDNLVNGGQTFVAEFTKIIADEIRKSRQ